MDPGDPEASAGEEDGAGGRSAQTAEKGERLPAGCASLAASSTGNDADQKMRVQKMKGQKRWLSSFSLTAIQV